MQDVIVIGGGIIGATIAKTLLDARREVLCLDREEPLGGTAPSGGHLKPSWLGMTEDEYKPGMEILDKTWGLIKEDFRYKEQPTTVFRVDTDVVVGWEGKDKANVERIEQLHNYPKVLYRAKDDPTKLFEERCRLLIVAAGIWTNELLHPHGYRLDIQPKQGVSFRITHQLAEPFIQEWAPYKQIVAHQQSATEVWMGDGTAILQKNWRDQRDDECLDRCLKVLNVKSAPYRKLHGIRPAVEKKTGICVMDHPWPRVWVVTGASKRGTIAAGVAAHKFLNMKVGG